MLFVIITILILVISGGTKSLETIIMISFFTTIVLIFIILADFIKIKRNIRLCKLILKDKKVYINGRLIKNDDIIAIKPIHISHYRWSLNIIEIVTESKTYHILDKPFMFWELLTDGKSRSANIIANNIFELKNKVLERITIHNQWPN